MTAGGGVIWQARNMPAVASLGGVVCGTQPAVTAWMHAKLEGDPSPGESGASFGGPDQQERESAEQDVRPDPRLDPVEHRPQFQGALEVTEPTFGLEQVLEAQRDVLSRQVRVGGREQVLAVQPLLSGDLGAVQDQPAGRQLAQPATRGGWSRSAHSAPTCAFSGSAPATFFPGVVPVVMVLRRSTRPRRSPAPPRAVLAGGRGRRSAPRPGPIAPVVPLSLDPPSK